MIAAILVLFVLPLLAGRAVKANDRSELLLKIFFYGLIFCFFALGYLGAMPAEAPYVVMSQIFTSAYFALFFLPILARV